MGCFNFNYTTGRQIRDGVAYIYFPKSKILEKRGLKEIQKCIADDLYGNFETKDGITFDVYEIMGRIIAEKEKKTFTPPKEKELRKERLEVLEKDFYRVLAIKENLEVSVKYKEDLDKMTESFSEKEKGLVNEFIEKENVSYVVNTKYPIIITDTLIPHMKYEDFVFVSTTDSKQGLECRESLEKCINLRAIKN